VQFDAIVPRLVDRVVMTAATVVLEAIFEVDMPAEQHGYRPHLSAHTAVREVDRLINRGHTRIITEIWGTTSDRFPTMSCSHRWHVELYPRQFGLDALLTPKAILGGDACDQSLTLYRDCWATTCFFIRGSPSPVRPPTRSLPAQKLFPVSQSATDAANR
jgi:hypothetical protein